MKKLFSAGFLAAAMLTSPALSGPITEGIWRLENNTNHSLGSAGFYRYNGSGYNLYDFEANNANVQMIYDADEKTVNISGQAYDTVEDRLVSFDLDYEGVSVVDNRIQFGASDAVGTFDGVDVMSKASKGRALYFDSAGLQTSLTGHGWLGTSAGHFGDFHINGTRIADLPNSSGGGGSVPAPGGLAIILAGAFALAYRKKQLMKA